MAHHVSDRVRIRRGNTVDTARVRGADLSGLKAEIISEPKVEPADGPDGKGPAEERCAVAIYDKRAPLGAGIVTIPTRYLESQSRIERTRSMIRGFGNGLAKTLGIVREQYVTRGGKRVLEREFKDGRREYAEA